MFQYIVRRVVTAIPVVFFVAVIAFALIRLAAGNPAVVFLGPGATDEDIALITRQLGLDQPIPVQFAIWIGNLLRGDLGRSFFLGRDVATAIVERMPATLLLTSAGLFFALLVGIPSGVVAAVKQNTWLDRAIMVFTLIGVSVPVFWIGLMLAWVFGVQLRWFPTGGYVPISEDLLGGLRYIVLPGIALGALHASLITRITRASMLDVIRQDYIRTAHAKGLRERPIVFGHALRNALIPTITVIGNSVGALLSGVVIIETVFTYPGIGRLVVSAVQQRDYNVVQGSLLVVAMLYVTINLLVDISYSLIDPRIRYD
jgi:peptide/nickel transport system permease protein